jgi:hypothetical protein
MVELIKVGMIGYNEGNGHPYSFSAILNGYNREEMELSSFPTIAKYLSLKSSEDFGVGNLKVTHVWCPEIETSKSIAKCCNIGEIASNYVDLLGKVDCVIIARDDANSHYSIAKMFLENEIPVFIDKPLCTNLQDLKFFEKYLLNGLLMSCSGLRYFPPLVNKLNDQAFIDDVVWSHNVSILDWYKYGIHVLEGAITVMGNDIEWVQNIGEDGNDIVRIQCFSGKFSIIQVNTNTAFVLKSTFYSKRDSYMQFDYNDNFASFKGLLVEFNNQITTKMPSIKPEETITIIKTMIASEVSKERQGVKIYLNELT